MQHLELARDIARSFNASYHQEVFPLPQPLMGTKQTETTSQAEMNGVVLLSCWQNPGQLGG